MPSNNVIALRAALIEADAARTRAVNADLAARSAMLEPQNKTMRRALYGQGFERGQLLAHQLELGYEVLEASAGGNQALARHAATGTNVKAFTHARLLRKPLPAHLPRERVVIAAPTSCQCCGSDRLSKFLARKWQRRWR